MRAHSPLQPFLAQHGVVVLDGGLATALEAAGHRLDDDLWSARLLSESPQSIGAVHESFLLAGADCIVTASYQATISGFRKRGMSLQEAGDLLLLSVQLALQARAKFLRKRTSTSLAPADRLAAQPLVAASIGPYGAFLADGSEYQGDYGLSDAALRDFHEPRWRVLSDSAADLLACETIPSRQEVRVLLELLRSTPHRHGWISVTCRDGTHLRDGSALRDVFSGMDDVGNLAAVGVNCTAPRFVASCIREIRRVTHKPVFVYPNSGEGYDATQRAWVAADETTDWRQAAIQWRALGAQGIGGCCRVGPSEIRRMRAALIPA